jgi:hypothetical protein
MPGRLKGKVDKKNGTFGVMLMAGPTTSDISKRDAEAKRASESTQLAAEQALAAGQPSLRSRRFIRLPPDPMPPVSSVPPLPPPPPPPPPPAPFYGLTDAGIKQEQARLLTVLRSLNPVRVVDQICTALAFFGGIPGAPPPPDGAFPPSAMANGSGRLFVSWIAEIFPPVPSYGPPILPAAVTLPVPAVAGPPPAPPEPKPDTMGISGKKRGRPKGSKSSKPRKDKGIKKGPIWSRPDPVPKPKSGRPVGRPRKRRHEDDADPGEESWLDVNQDEEEAEGDATFDGPVAGSVAVATMSPEGPPPGRTALPPGNQATTGDGTPRRRGRPKGSKTRTPKTAAGTASAVAAPASHEGPVGAQVASIAPPTSSGAVSQGPENVASFTPVNSALASQSGSGPGPAAVAAAQPDSQPKKPGVRAKGAKNNPKADKAAATATEVLRPLAAYGDLPYVAHQTTSVEPAQVATLALPQSPSQSTAVDSTVQAPAVTQKRKRKSKKDTRSIAQDALDNSALTLPTDAAPRKQQLGEVTETSSTQPPAKRQRKSNDTTSNAKSNAKASANTNSKADGQPFDVDTFAGSNVVPDTQEHQFEAASPAPAQDPLSLDVEHAISSLQSPRDDSHFDMDSPTMENYQAQLHANLGQESAPEPVSLMPSSAAHSRAAPRHVLANQQQQQQYQQPQYQQRQLHGQKQSQQPLQSSLQVSQSSGELTRSPIFSQQATEPHQNDTRSSQNGAGVPQTNFQYRLSGVQQAKSPVYAPQQAAQARSSVQTQNAKAGQGQQYPPAARQYKAVTQPQYAGAAGPPQYPSHDQQQQVAPGARYPQLRGTTAATSSFTTTQSSQFSPSNGATGYNFNATLTPSYTNPAQQRPLPANAAASKGVRTGANNPTSQSQKHQRTSSSTSSQSMGSTGLQSFPAVSNSAADGGAWDMFDATGGVAQSQSGVGITGYGAAAGTGDGAAARGAASGATSQGGMGGFDGAVGAYWKR